MSQAVAHSHENPVLQAIRQRRSVRSYQPRQVSDDLLEAVLEAGRHAPSGGNNQTSHFLVLQNPRVLDRLRQLVCAEFAAMEETPDLYPSIAHSIRSAKKGGYDFCFGAPTLVVMANRKGYGNAMADCAVALENMMLAALSLGLGSCWINQLRWLDDNPAVRAFLEELGLAEEETVCGGLSLGYPAVTPGSALPRTGNPVTYVR